MCLWRQGRSAQPSMQRALRHQNHPRRKAPALHLLWRVVSCSSLSARCGYSYEEWRLCANGLVHAADLALSKYLVMCSAAKACALRLVLETPQFLLGAV